MAANASTVPSGVDARTTEALMRLQLQGYVVFERMLDADVLGELQQAFSVLLDEYARSEAGNRGVARYGIPLPFVKPFTSPAFVANPTVVSLLGRLLGDDFVCSYFASDTPLPGSDYQHAHSDLAPLFPEANVAVPPFAYVMNVPLVDFRDENGPLEIWPNGSHNFSNPQYIPLPRFDDISAELASSLQQLAAEMNPIRVLASAGSVILRDLRMWHRGTPNRSDTPRPMLSLVFNRPWYHHGTLQIPRREYSEMEPVVQQLFRQAVLTD